MISRNTLLNQYIPLLITFVVFGILAGLLIVLTMVLNIVTPSCTQMAACISGSIHFTDVLVGITIYLKTSVDFAIFIGNLMHAYPTWRGRIAIEIGTAVGNALGTALVLILWDVFKEIKILLAAMILLATLVLLKLAQDGLEHTHAKGYALPRWFYFSARRLEQILSKINGFIAPFLSRIMPNISMKAKPNKGFFGLFALSFSIPFILGLDDFAGYVPVFNIVNVLGFSIGVLLGHMILNILLFISPQHTINAVKNPVISYLGSVAFIMLALWGMYEVFHLLTSIH